MKLTNSPTKVLDCGKHTKTESFILKDYYQSDRPTPPFYRHSQTDLTEWDEQQQHQHHHENGRPNGHSNGGGGNNNHHASHPNRRSGPPEREPPQGSNGYGQSSYGRNGSHYNGKDKQQQHDDWEDGDRLRREPR